MKHLIALALVAASTVAAQATELRPIEAASIELGPVKGVAYYDLRGSQCYLVATLAQGEGLPVRFSSMLAPQERVSISVPGPAGAAAQEIVFTRHGDSVVVSGPQPVRSLNN
jgi:hypothetical protein